MIIKSSKILLADFRADLQLHFFWSFLLTSLAVFFPLMIWSGLILTLVKETLDLWTKGSWNWDDIVYGVIGWIVGLLFLKPHLVGFFS